MTENVFAHRKRSKKSQLIYYDGILGSDDFLDEMV